MDKTLGKNENDKEILLEHLKKVNRQERWLFREKSKEFISSSEKISDDKRPESIDKTADIVDVLNRRNQLRALYEALDRLKENDRTIIEEFYFSDCRKTKTELACLHNISRIGYKHNLDRAISHLRTIFLNIYEDEEF